MLLSVPLHLSSLFILLVFIIAFVILIAVYVSGHKAELTYAERRRNFLSSIAVILTWLCYTAIISFSGLLNDFNAMPPRIMLVVVPPLIILAVLLISTEFLKLTEQINMFWLIYLQSFRVVMEFILWLLHRNNIIPVQMSFEGMNFDVLTGITAPFVAYFCFRKKTWSPKLALWWNFAGIALLVNIVVIAVLSTPYPFRYFMNEPANHIVFHFPFVWLPGFVVPVALLLHLISIRRLLKNKTSA